MGTDQHIGSRVDDSEGECDGDNLARGCVQAGRHTQVGTCTGVAEVAGKPALIAIDGYVPSSPSGVSRDLAGELRMAGVCWQLIGREALGQCGLDPQQGIGHGVIPHVVANIIPQGPILDDCPAGLVEDFAQRAPEVVEVQGDDPRANREGVAGERRVFSG